jgi:hypothetical protein
MATAELKVRIDAETGELKKGLDQANQKLGTFASKANSSVGGVAKSFTLLNNTKFTFGQNYVSASQALANQAKKTSETLGGSVAKGSNQAAFALTNLGRVAQDAPFGFIGIQNNLNPLLESFQRLKAETGSTSLAFKALGASLLGPAGIGIALSVVSSAILFYQQYQQKANRETKVAADAYKELADSIQTTAEVQADGRKNASSELSSLQSLYKATQDLTIPQAERLKIAKQLIKENPEYLKGFTAEEVIAGKAAIAYQKLTSAILAKGLAEAGAINRQKLVNKQLEDTISLTKAEQQAANDLAKTRSQGQALPGLAAAFESKQITDAANQSVTEVNRLKVELANTAKEIQLIDNVTSDLIKNLGAEIVIDTEKPKQLGKEVKTTSNILKALSVDFKQIGADFSITFGKGNQERVGALKKAINELISIGADSSIIQKLQSQLLSIDPAQITQKGKEVGVSAAVGIGAGIASQGEVIATTIGEKLKIGLTDWQVYVNNDLLPKVQTNFETFFNDILMRGKLSFESLGKAILNTFLSIAASDAARQMTNLFKFKEEGSEFTQSKKDGGPGLLGGIFSLLKIGGGKAAATAATTTAATGGTAAVATGTAATGGALLPILAGVAAVAGIATLLKKKQPTQPTPAFTTSNAISTASSSNVDFGSGRVVFEISGVNLVGVLNRAGAKLQRFGP